MTTPQTTARVQDAQEIFEAVWSFMTSVKSVRKRGGAEQTFEKDKLLASIRQALESCGILGDARAQRILGQVATRLTKQFEGLLALP